MIITRINNRCWYYYILMNFEMAARVGSQREIDWATTMTTAVAAKMFPQERRFNFISTYLLLTVT